MRLRIKILLSIALLSLGNVFAIDPPKKPLTPCSFSTDIAATHVGCYGDSTGAAELTVIGSGTYTYAWDNGETSKDVSNLPAKTYFVDVTDQTGCVVRDLVTITQPFEISLSFDVTPVQCNGEADASIDMTVNGGTPDFLYNWSNGETGEDNDAIVAGTYAIEVTDQNFCTATDTIVITEPEEITSSNVTTNVSCNGGSDGEIELFVFGGTEPYDYSWTTGDTLVDVYNLVAGTHTVTITDDNGCQLIVPIEVTEPDEIATSFTTIDVSCDNGSDGEIDLEVNGGTSPYTFVWSNSLLILSDATEDIDSLSEDTYKVRVTDAQGCIHYDSVEISAPQVLITNVTGVNVTCYSGSDGSVDLSVSGGEEPYAYQWDNGETSQDLTNVTAGTYSVVIADSNNCTATASFEVTEPDEIVFGFDVSEVSCKDNDDGEIQAYVSGGTSPYTYSWDNGEATSLITDLDGGVYTLTVTDDSLCTGQASVEVTVNPQICLWVPSGFTPNDDSYNDIWNIRNSELYPSISVLVYNRWGNLVFESKGYSEEWDGTFNGKPVPSDTYYYIIDLGNGDDPFSGGVTVLR